VALTFSCGCGASITVPDVLAGHEGRCPGCDATLRAPGPAVTAPASATATPGATQTDPAGVRVVEGTPRGALAPATKTRLILEFPCPGCREVLRVAMAHAGKQGRCSLCGATFAVPAAPAEPAPPAPSAPPPRAAFKVVRVDCACGRQVPTPLARLEQGLARCPTCDRPLR
jgi:hypothetical protein